MAVRGRQRIEAFDALIARDHGTRISVLNKALDIMIEHEAKLEQLAAGMEVSHA